MRKMLLLMVALVGGWYGGGGAMAWAREEVKAEASRAVQFWVLRNPLFPVPSQDPWVVEREGRFYEVGTDGLRVRVRIADHLPDLGRAEPHVVWHAPRRGLGSQHVWAPEMHWVEGRWWIYLSADDGKNENHRIYVLRSRTTNPLDGFETRGQWATGGWAIDPTVFRGGDGVLYALWSGWPLGHDGEQALYISKMDDPATLTGRPVLLTRPTEPWEKVGMPICEGPQILQRDRVTLAVYSASGSWTKSYCLGMLVNRTGDYLNPAAWKKEPHPVFAPTKEVWGVGHCCFLSSPETGDLIFYHAKTRDVYGWEDRDVRVQPFTWRRDGLPDFGKPVNPELPIEFMLP